MRPMPVSKKLFEIDVGVPNPNNVMDVNFHPNDSFSSILYTSLGDLNSAE